MSDFPAFPKIPRLSRDCVITEKLDGTSGLIEIVEISGISEPFEGEKFVVHSQYELRAGSRSRWLDTTKTGDNYGFAKWTRENAVELVKLGPGLHYGEWYGKGIQRNYGLTDRRFSLFNTHRWNDSNIRPSCCEVVPILYTGIFETNWAYYQLDELKASGSRAAPGFMFPEGIMVFHIAAGQYFKKTIKDDESPKEKK